MNSFLPNLTIFLLITVAASLGTFGGAYLSQFINPKQLQRVFGYFLLVIVSFILFQNRSKIYSFIYVDEDECGVRSQVFLRDVRADGVLDGGVRVRATYFYARVRVRAAGVRG